MYVHHQRVEPMLMRQERAVAHLAAYYEASQGWSCLWSQSVQEARGSDRVMQAYRQEELRSRIVVIFTVLFGVDHARAQGGRYDLYFPGLILSKSRTYPWLVQWQQAFWWVTTISVKSQYRKAGLLLFFMPGKFNREDQKDLSESKRNREMPDSSVFCIEAGREIMMDLNACIWNIPNDGSRDKEKK